MSDLKENIEFLNNIEDDNINLCQFKEKIAPLYTLGDQIDNFLENYNSPYNKNILDLFDKLSLRKNKYIEFSDIKKLVSESKDIYRHFIKFHLNDFLRKRIGSDVSTTTIYNYLINNISDVDDIMQFCEKSFLDYDDIKTKLFLKISHMSNLSDDDKNKIKYYFSGLAHMSIKNFDYFLTFIDKLNGKVSFNIALEFFNVFNELVPMIIGDYKECEEINDLQLYRACKRHFSIMVKYFPREYLPKEIKEIFINTDELVKRSSKINILEANKNLNFEFMKNIFPNLGLDISSEIIKFDSHAIENIINCYKDNEKYIIDYYLELIKKFNLFDLDARGLHSAFNDFNCIYSLIKELSKLKINLSFEEALNLKRLILNKNCLKIFTIEDFKKYEFINKQYVFNNLGKREIGALFGHSCYITLEQEVDNFGLKDFVFLKKIYSKILANYDKDTFERVKFTKYEIAIIKLLNNLKDNKFDKSKLFKIFENFYEKEGKFDFIIEYQNIISKMREAYALYLNAKLTSQADLSKCRKDNIAGVDVFYFDDEDFNFLVHVIYGYTSECANYVYTLEENPNLWEHLEGSSTISLSSISDKNFNFVDSENPTKIKLLFNYIFPKNFLYMYPEDLYVEHGTQLFNPKVDYNVFNILEIHNSKSNFHTESHNELACYRDDIVPFAIGVFDDMPNALAIRIAKKMNLPIVCINKSKYLKDEEQKELTNLEVFKKSPSPELISKLLLANDIKVETSEILELILNNFNEDNIDFQITHNCLTELAQFIELLHVSDIPVNLVKKYRLIIDVLLKSFPDKKIKIDMINSPNEDIKLSIDDNIYMIKECDEQCLKQMLVSQSLRNYFGIDNNYEINFFSKKFNLLSHKTKLNNDWFQLAPETLGGYNDTNIYKNIIYEFVLDYLLGLNKFSDIPFLIDENKNIVRSLNDCPFNSSEYTFINNFNRIRMNPIYKEMFNECHHFPSVARDVSNYINDMIYKLDELTEQNVLDIIENISVLDNVEKVNVVSNIMLRKDFVLDVLKTIKDNYVSEKILDYGRVRKL